MSVLNDALPYQETIKTLASFDKNSEFYQQLYALLMHYSQWAQQVGADQTGIEHFLNQLQQNPNAYQQGPLYYETIKANLEDSVFLLAKKDKSEQQKILNYLSQQLELCGPGIFNTVIDIHRNLVDSNKLEDILTKFRETILYQVAEEFIAQESIEPAYSLHVHSQLQKLAHKNGFKISSGFNFNKLCDKHAREDKTHLTTENESALLAEVKKRYSDEKIIQHLLFHYQAKLKPFIGKNLSTDISPFNQIMQPFTEVLGYEQIVNHNEDYTEVTLKPEFVENLSCHITSVLKYKAIIDEKRQQPKLNVEEKKKKVLEELETNKPRFFADSEAKKIKQQTHELSRNPCVESIHNYQQQARRKQKTRPTLAYAMMEFVQAIITTITSMYLNTMLLVASFKLCHKALTNNLGSMTQQGQTSSCLYA